MTIKINADRLKDEIQIHYDAKLSDSGEVYESVIDTLEKYMSKKEDAKFKGFGESLVVKETALHNAQSECIKGVFLGNNEAINIVRIDLDGRTATIIGDRLYFSGEYFPKQDAKKVVTFKELGL